MTAAPAMEQHAVTTPCLQQAYRGFSMIELIIVLAVVGIVASLALPAWSSYSQRSRHANAITQMNAISLSLEHYFSEHLTYETDIASLRMKEVDKWYRYLLRRADAAGYLLEAVPRENNSGGALFRMDDRRGLQHRWGAEDPWLPGWP